MIRCNLFRWATCTQSTKVSIFIPRRVLLPVFIEIMEVLSLGLVALSESFVPNIVDHDVTPEGISIFGRSVLLKVFTCPLWVPGPHLR